MNNTPEQFDKITDEQIDRILLGAPRFDRSPEAEAKFFKQLEIAAAKKLALQQTRDARAEAKRKLHPADMLTDALIDETRQSRAWFAWPRLAFAGSFAALLLVVGGTFASYQDSTTRGDLLYGLKQTAEKVELAFAFSDLGKVDAHLRFSDRRLREAENIVEENPSLAWLFQAASADDGNSEIDLDSKEEKYLGLTLDDMQTQVTMATRIVEEKIDVAVKAEAALAKIEVVTDNHVVALGKIEKRVAPKIKIIVKQVAREEDDRIAAVVEAREDVKVAIAEKKRIVKVQFTKEITATAAATTAATASTVALSETAARAMSTTEPGAEAKIELTEAQKIFDTLTEEQRAEYKEKMDMARGAFASGKYGKTKGLSRSLNKQLDKFPKPPVKQTTPGFIPTEEVKAEIKRLEDKLEDLDNKNTKNAESDEKTKEEKELIEKRLGNLQRLDILRQRYDPNYYDGENANSNTQESSPQADQPTDKSADEPTDEPSVNIIIHPSLDLNPVAPIESGKLPKTTTKNPEK